METYAGTKPDASESTANKQQSLKMIARLSLLILGSNDLFSLISDTPFPISTSRSEISGSSSPSPPKEAFWDSSPGSSICGLNENTSTKFTAPINAYAKKTAWYDRTGSHPSSACSCCTTHPVVNFPAALPAEPITVYQAKISLLISGGVRCARVDSS